MGFGGYHIVWDGFVCYVLSFIAVFVGTLLYDSILYVSILYVLTVPYPAHFVGFDRCMLRFCTFQPLYATTLYALIWSHR